MRVRFGPSTLEYSNKDEVKQQLRWIIYDLVGSKKYQRKRTRRTKESIIERIVERKCFGHLLRIREEKERRRYLDGYLRVEEKM